MRSGVLTPRRAWVLGLLAGLGVSNHHEIIWMAPLPLLVLWHARERGWRWWVARLGVGALGALVGLIPYAQIIVRGGARVWPRWGETSSLEGFLTPFLRREYGTFSLGLLSATGQTPRHGLAHLARTVADLGPTLALAAIGGWALWRHHATPVRRFGLAVLASWLLAGPVSYSHLTLPTKREG